MSIVNENKRQRYEKTIAQFCLMDDTFMVKVFENNILETEILLHTILENDKIKVIKAVGQYAVKNLQERSMRLDMYVQNEHGRHFNAEVQRLNAGTFGAEVQRLKQLNLISEKFLAQAVYDECIQPALLRNAGSRGWRS